MRLVSLCPSLTELIFALGGGENLVGITTYCVRPAGQVEAIEKVGGTKKPKLESIVELQPDLVLLNEEENRVDDARALEAAGLRCHISFPKTVEDVAGVVRSIGKAIDRGRAADSIGRVIEDSALRAREAGRGRLPVRWCYLIWRKPWMTLNSDTYIHDLLSLPGGENVFGHLPDRYPAVSGEEIGEANSDAVFLSTEPFPFEEKHIAELVSTTGVPGDRFHIVDGQLLSWHGASTPAGIDYAIRLLEDLRM